MVNTIINDVEFSFQVLVAVEMVSDLSQSGLNIWLCLTAECFLQAVVHVLPGFGTENLL